MATIDFSLGNRAKPIKKLPTNVEVPENATVEDAKRVIARQAGILDFNRVGIYDASTKALLKDRRAAMQDIKSRSLLVKDLGELCHDSIALSDLPAC